jgi:hypothetical protein
MSENKGGRLFDSRRQSLLGRDIRQRYFDALEQPDGEHCAQFSSIWLDLHLAQANKTSGLPNVMQLDEI